MAGTFTQIYLQAVFAEGYGAFSYGHSQIKRVYNYILHQEKHHRKKTFREEYLEFLEKFQISYEDRFLFEWLD